MKRVVTPGESDGREMVNCRLGGSKMPPQTAPTPLWLASLHATKISSIKSTRLFLSSSTTDLCPLTSHVRVVDGEGDDSDT